MTDTDRTSSASPLAEADIDRLQTLFDQLPAPLEPLDASMLDGYLCGVLLQPQAVAAGEWLRHVFDIDGRAPAPGTAGLQELQGLVQRRFQELSRAVEGRQWFDPWIFEMDEDASPLETALPWVAGFAAAMEFFPGLLRLDDPALQEPLAVLYAALDPEDLEDADDLLEVIETLEPPATLDDAVQDIVQSVLRLADVGRPEARRPSAGRPAPGQGSPRGRARR